MRSARKVIFSFIKFGGYFLMNNANMQDETYIFQFVRKFSFQVYAVLLVLTTISPRNRPMKNVSCFETPCITAAVT